MSARLLCLIVLRLLALGLCFLYFPIAFFQMMTMGSPAGLDWSYQIPLFLFTLVPLFMGILLWKIAPRLAAIMIPEDDVIRAEALTEMVIARLVLQLCGVYLAVRNVGRIVSTLITFLTLPRVDPQTAEVVTNDWALRWIAGYAVELVVGVVLIFYAGRIAAWLARREDA